MGDPIPDRLRFYRNDLAPVMMPLWDHEADTEWQQLLVAYFRGKPSVAGLVVCEDATGRELTLTAANGDPALVGRILDTLCKLVVRGQPTREAALAWLMDRAATLYRLKHTLPDAAPEAPGGSP